MASIDSRSPGVLTPLASENTGEVENRLRLFVSLAVGLDPKVVRKRWTQKPGTQPPVGADWCAVGVTEIRTHGFPNISGVKGKLDDPETGTVTSDAHQSLYCVATFYGPNAQELSDRLRSALMLTQNISYLQYHGLTVQNVDDSARHIPEFAFQQWIDRYDLSFTIGRKVSRTYGVRTLVSADADISANRN